MASTLTFTIANNFMRTMFRLFARWRVEGRDLAPRGGPLVVVANHAHYLDPPFVNASLPRQVLFLAKRELITETRGFQHFCLVSYGLIPMERDRLDRAAFQQAMAHLEGGGAMGIFPEGTRNRTGALQRARPGAAYLVLQLGAPVLPVGIAGLERVRDLGRGMLRRPRIDVRIGPPFTLPFEATTNRATLTAATDYIMERIAELLPPAQRGYYGERDGQKRRETSAS